MTISYEIIAQSHEVGGSKTDDISEYSVRTYFPINAVSKWGWWFQTIYFDQEKDIAILTKNVQEIWNAKEMAI